MNTHIDKKNETKSNAVANAVAVKQSVGQQVTDNRPQAIAQRKIQDAAGNSLQVMQLNAIQALVNSSPQVQQLRAAQAIANNNGYHTTQLKAIIKEETVQERYKPVPEKSQIKGAEPANFKAIPVQRLVKTKLGLDDDAVSVVKVSRTSERPGTGLPGGSQGDHTTPFSVLQDQIVNAMAELPITDAWAALRATYTVYTSLPGWASLLKKFHWLRDRVVLLNNAEGNIAALEVAANEMLSLRQKIPLTNIARGGRGQAEGHWLSGIRLAERKLQLNTAAVLDKSVTKKNAMVDMWRAFDFKRVKAIKVKKRKKNILMQHAITICDAYPLLSARLGINYGILYAQLLAWAKQAK